MLVSVVIAAFNAEQYVAKAIISACRQTYSDIEIVVVDDGSSDRTRSIVQTLAETDGRVRLLTHPERKGVSAARNLGMRASGGEWIAILDADDEFAPTRIATMVSAAVKCGLDLIADNLEMRDFTAGAPMGKAFLDQWMIEGGDVSLKFLLERDVPVGLKCRELGFIKPIIRRKFIGDHDITYCESVWAAEDLLFYAECLARGARMRFIRDALYIYYVRSGSASSGRDVSNATEGLRREQLRKVNTMIRSMVGTETPELVKLLRRRAAMMDYKVVVWHLQSRRAREAIRVAAGSPSGYLFARLGFVLLNQLFTRWRAPAKQDY